MTRISMTCLGTWYQANLLGKPIAFCAVAAFAIGCASTPPPLPDEDRLTAAGFKMLVAKTVQQQEHLQSLPPGTVTAMQRNGTHFFVYPDAARNRIYVGTPKEYQAYQRSQPGNQASVQGQLSGRQAADMASYLKQDDALQKATQRDLSDPYFFWPSFFELGW